MKILDRLPIYEEPTLIEVRGEAYQVKPFFPLAADQPLTILSRPEALNASGSRRACRMAISRNAWCQPGVGDFTAGCTRASRSLGTPLAVEQRTC